MKIRSFAIENYRAINRIVLNLNYSINPIIGVNESGKTTILQAILAFDKGRDRYNDGEHLDPQNKYSTKDTKNSKVTATINLEKDEIETLLKCGKVKTDSLDYTEIRGITPKTEIRLSRLLSDSKREYVTENPSFSPEVSKRVSKFLVEHLPVILYFDDFTDRVPEDIQFPEEYLQTKKLSRSYIRDWQEIIEEIFKRADNEGIEGDENPLRTFMKIDIKDRKKDILSDIENVLNNEIIKDWKKIKKSGKTQFADDSDKLELVIDNEGNNFKFKVKDKSNEDKSRTFNVNERSKGFQWFFNYMIKLKFNPRYKKTKDNSIFLLDEPGSYLHSSAQSELLKELDSVSNRNTIVFCTHSQFLLNPDVIKLGSIRIAEKEKSKISLHDYGNYKSKNDKSALSPIYQALQLNCSNDFLGNLVITEGITDYYFIEMVKKNTKLIKTDFKVIPGTGAGNSSTLICLALPFSDNFIILLDNDDAGHTAAKKYIKEFGEHLKTKLHFYNEQQNDCKLEDLFDKQDKENLLKITSASNIKKAIPILYFDLKAHQASFFKSLSQKTLDNVSDTIMILNKF